MRTARHQRGGPRRRLQTAGRLAIISLLVLCGAQAVRPGAVREVLIGTGIPEYLTIESQFIFHASDTLVFNGRTLQPGVDYVFQPRTARFDLSRLKRRESDTLVVIYEPVPAWVQRSYGRPLPEPPTSDRQPRLPSPTDGYPPGHRPPSDLQLTGAKTFRFTARSTGTSDFGQSLDLNISGELSPGLSIKGAISDRGYDPSYGTANSRLNELDKISLELTSQKLRAQVGDIEIAPGLCGGTPRAKRVSGLSLFVADATWSASAVAARPKGRHASTRFQGSDGRQGPYQVAEGAGLPVVPGSETVWLDGQELERGSNRDYTVYYPTGQITFTAKHPIDSRSRIEIDYEPQTTDYRGELFSGGGGVAFADSAASLAFEWTREGDDPDLPQEGDLSEDDLAALAASGDDVASAVRSGVYVDSGGSYRLVADSLPDSVFSYVGPGDGGFTIRFGYVGPGEGDYRFLGSGQYEYVGSGGGDYLPLVRVPAPERTDHYAVLLGLKNDLVDETVIELRGSNHDRNLLSSLDDADNIGGYYALRSHKAWEGSGRDNHLSVTAHYRDDSYRERARLHAADFERDFLLPDSVAAGSDECLAEIEARLSLAEFLAVRPGLSRLNYSDRFRSVRSSVAVEIEPGDRTSALAGVTHVDSRVDTTSVPRDAEGNTLLGRVRYDISERLTISAEGEFDRRRHDYFGETRGTRFLRAGTTIDYQTEQLSYERFDEDTLDGQWKEALRRDRLTLTSNRRLGDLSTDMTLTQQWLDQPQQSESEFLARLGYQYHNSRSHLDVSGAYTMSTETRNGRGITFIEVEPGEGDYSLEDGSYVPDPDGNYLRVEEILSDFSRVRRGEKSFRLAKDWRVALLKFTSRVEEELLPEGNRGTQWIIPFVSDPDQPYLYYVRRYDVVLNVLPTGGYHALNLAFSEDLAHRHVAGVSRRSLNRTESVTLRQGVKAWRLEEALEIFEINRDAYYVGSGDLDGFRCALGVRRLMTLGEVETRLSYRQAEAAAGGSSKQYRTSVSVRVQAVARGELRASIEGYLQDLSVTEGTTTYSLTDDRPGEKGAIWSLDFRYGIRDGLRINMSVNGRNADNRTARTTGRCEVIAGF